MRKITVLAFFCVGIACMAALFFPQAALVPDAMRAEAFREMPPSLAEDLALALDHDGGGLEVSFSHEGFFHGETIHVSITASNPDASIYYTTDGSDPAAGGERYSHPLEFVTGDTVRCIVLKAIAIDSGGRSPVLTRSYFVGVDIGGRFQGLVFSISTDVHNLYDYERGILVRGQVYDEFMAANPNTDIPERRRPANNRMRGREWERPAYIEAFSSDGERIIAQNAGFRLHGSAARGGPHNSFRIVARREYEPGIGMFGAELFPGYLSVGEYGLPIMSFDTLILRRSGNDWFGGRIRTPLISQIALEAGYSSVSPQAAAAVFINGVYHGHAWVSARINEQFLERLYDAPQRAFEIVDGGNRWVDGDEDLQREFALVLEHAERGFTEETVRHLESFFDIDDLLFYYAIQAYSGSTNWPDNNMRMWRYTGSVGADNLADELDGRWRFLLYDIDRSLNLTLENSPDARSIGRLLEGEDSSPILRALLQMPDYAEKFANYICDMASDHFSALNVRRVVDEIDHASLSEIRRTMERYGRDFEEIMLSREQMHAFFEERPGYMLDELREIFGYANMYRIVSDGSAKIGTMNGIEGLYFVEHGVLASPVLVRGQAFDHWLVNGAVRYEENLLISAQDADADGVVYVRIVTNEVLPPLLFGDTFDKGDLFGFTMYNPTDSVQSTLGLYLSDDIRDLRRWRFPALSISPGSAWEFVGRDSSSLDALLKIGLNFNPRHGEIVFLSDEDGTILDYTVMRR